MDIRSHLSAAKEEVDGWLEQCLPEGESLSRPVFDAMRYSLMSDGKRLRPILLYSTAQMVGGGDERMVKAFACAIECIHAYSLIHDDLPAMDDDDLRRGRPTCHKKFSEAIAILAGDALLTLAFELMSRPYVEDGSLQIRAINLIAHEAGCFGMIGGQTADILPQDGEDDSDRVRFIHSRKTGALISASVKAGATLAGATEEELSKLGEFARRIGMAFQIVDDLLEIGGDAKTLGKNVDSDAKNERLTYPGVVGVDEARHDAEALIGDAVSHLGSYGAKAAVLRGIAEFFVNRVS